MRATFDWNDGAYVPDKECYCLCEMDGQQYNKYAVLRWDGMYWLVWVFVNNESYGWCGLSQKWKIKRWCIIEDYENRTH